MGTALNTLAASHQVQGRFAEALPLYERSLRITEKAAGLGGPDAAYLLNNVAVLMFQLGRQDECMKLLHETREKMEKKLGSQHPMLAWLLRAIGRTHLRMRQFPEAARALEQAVAILLTQKDDARGVWTATQNDLGFALLRTGQPRQALTPLERALAGWEHAKPTPMDRANTRFLLGWALWDAAADKARALRLIAEARQQATALEGPEAAHLLADLEAWRQRNGAPKLPEVPKPAAPVAGTGTP
jgi:tetratricopeptide (TPR) repeat protein